MSERTDAIIRALDEEKTDLVILAGYMSVLEPEADRGVPKQDYQYPSFADSQILR